MVSHEIHSHRAPSRQTPLLAGLIAGLTALALTAGVLFSSHQPAPQTAPVDLVLPIGAPAEMGQWCVDHNTAAFRATLTTAGRNLLKGCVELWGVGLSPSPSPTPTPSPSATQTPSPSPSTTTPAPTTSPPASITAPATTPPAPSPSPTTIPSPTPTGPVLGCMPAPSRCGWPDATNTGVLPGSVLSVRAGKVLLGAGASLIDTQVNGCVQITGPNVTIHNVRIVSGCSYADIDLEDNVTTNAQISDVEIDMSKLADTSDFTGRLNRRSITGNDFTARRVWWHGGSDCVHYGSRVVIEDSFCDVARIPAGYPGDPHIDGFQSAGGSGVTIRHNTIRNPNDQTSAIINGTTPGVSAPQYNVRILSNLMAGGGYTVYCNAHQAATSPTVEFRDNRIARTYWPRGGYWGPMTDCLGVPGASTTLWDETGAAVPVG